MKIDSFLAYTIGILVYFVGMWANRKVNFLRTYSIPEPVTGGIVAALLSLGLFLATGTALEYELGVRDRMLVYFFTCIGINARLSDLVSGGKPLIILLFLTCGYIVVQDLVGTLGAQAIGQPEAVGVIIGSAALIGGHGTAIAWAPEIEANHGVPGALEIGVAAATLGLVIASLMGGPVAKYLMGKFSIEGNPSEAEGISVVHEDTKEEQINHVSFMRVIFLIHVAIIAGWFLNLGLAGLGLKLPLFVSCLLVGIVLSNTVPLLMPKLRWPARTKSLAIISEFSLGLYIAMSLMGMQLWSIAGLAGPLFILLGLQVLSALVFIRFVLFPLMGRDYMAAVLSAGFAGFSLGATPTAIANMTSVTKTHGPAPTAFIILPLVGAFFVDLVNAFVIQFFLR